METHASATRRTLSEHDSHTRVSTTLDDATVAALSPAVQTATHEFLQERGIDQAVWEARGCRRYVAGDRWVKEEFRPFVSSDRLANITLIVSQTGGWLMPKHAPPGFPPIPPQLRPDREVVTDPRCKWHWHESDALPEQWPILPPEAKELAGLPVFRSRMLRGEAAAAHINKGLGKEVGAYDPVTGEGAHKGVNVAGVHMHAPRAAKYILQGGEGAGSRIDLHPWALDRLVDADEVFFVLEGCPKNDSVLSAGAAVFSVPSVTCWKTFELRRFANRYLRGKVVWVVPDADWATNWQVGRQALKVRSTLRWIGMDAHIAAPPFFDGPGYAKGVDDHLGDGRGDVGKQRRPGRSLDELVIDGPEPPMGEIRAAVHGIDHHLQRRRALHSLENMSLYADEDGRLTGSFAGVKNILGVHKWQEVVPQLQALAHTFTIEQGSLETERRTIRAYNGKTRKWMTLTETVWKEKPIFTLDDNYRADRPMPRSLGDTRRESAALELIRTARELAATGGELLRRDAEERKWLREHGTQTLK